MENIFSMSFKKQCDERVNNLYTLIIKFIMITVYGNSFSYVFSLYQITGILSCVASAH